jgi:uncharacterized protein (TIGR03790 family)
VLRRLLLFCASLVSLVAQADGLTADRLGVIYNKADPASVRIAEYYRERRAIPAANLFGLTLPSRSSLSRAEFTPLRAAALRALPSDVQSLLLVWSRPYAVECMSVTSAFAAGYQPAFCEPGCERTEASPLFNSRGWLPADTIGWFPAMLLPSDDENLARAVIDRGIKADGSKPAGTAYLVRTQDKVRNVRALGYADTRAIVGNRLQARELDTPLAGRAAGALAYFTGVARVVEIHQIDFLPGAAADHLTSTGGQLDDDDQMSALEWLRQGATASYGTVSEPCAHPGKFPSPAIFLDHYLRGETILEAYWKSVAMPGQGLFIGEPLAQPFRR